MLLAVKPNLDPADPRHLILELGANAQHSLAVHGFRRPVVRAPDDALHAAFRACHEEADRGALGGEEGCCHVAYSTVSFGRGRRRGNWGGRRTSVYKGEDALVTWTCGFGLLH